MDKRQKLKDLVRFLQSQTVKSDEIADSVLFPSPISKAVYQKSLINAELALSICMGFIQTVPDDNIEAMFIALKNMNLRDFDQFIKEAT